MNDDRTGGGVMFDEALTTRLQQARWSRREFLARVAAFGAATALTQLLAACAGPAASSTPAPTQGPVATPSGTQAAAATPTPEPTPVPPPEDELVVYNWDGYIGEETVQRFQDKYGIKVKYENFPDETTQIGKLQIDGKGGGYDVSYPASTWMPEFIASGLVREIDHSLIPNLANLAPEWQNPGYDPDNRYSVPNAWWTTGFAWDPRDISGDPTNWDKLWDQTIGVRRLDMLDDLREVFAVGAFRLGFSPNTTDPGELDQILALLKQQKDLGIVRDYTTDHVADIINGSANMAHCWSGDWVQMTYDRPRMLYAIPGPGSIKGNDVMIITSGAAHPIAAHLWIDFQLDAHVSASNTNYIGYMGPNLAAREFIQDYIVNDPRLNPPKEVLDELVELKYLTPDELALYSDRWVALKAYEPA